MEQKKDAIYSVGMNSAKVIPVIETKTVAGKGTEEDPNRVVIRYWSLDGHFLAEGES